MPNIVDEKVRARAVRLVQERRGEYPPLSKALKAVAWQEGVGKESLRRWVCLAEIDAGSRQVTPSRVVCSYTSARFSVLPDADWAPLNTVCASFPSGSHIVQVLANRRNCQRDRGR